MDGGAQVYFFGLQLLVLGVAQLVVGAHAPGIEAEEGELGAWQQVAGAPFGKIGGGQVGDRLGVGKDRVDRGESTQLTCVVKHVPATGPALDWRF